MTFARKSSSALVIFLFSLVLEFTGYDKNLEVQAVSAQNGIKYVMAFTCIIFMVLGYVMARRYVLSQEKNKQVQKYLNKISGPLLDRIDIQVEITPVPFEELSKSMPSESSATIRERVIRARQIQEQRFANEPGIHCNAQMTPRLLQQYAALDAHGKSLLETAMDKLNLSARAYDRILKVARTIADLDNSPTVQAMHLAEAIGYRSLDRETWGT